MQSAAQLGSYAYATLLILGGFAGYVSVRTCVQRRTASCEGGPSPLFPPLPPPFPPAPTSHPFNPTP
jgi:hypothetical protein